MRIDLTDGACRCLSRRSLQFVVKVCIWAQATPTWRLDRLAKDAGVANSSVPNSAAKRSSSYCSMRRPFIRHLGIAALERASRIAIQARCSSPCTVPASSL